MSCGTPPDSSLRVKLESSMEIDLAIPKSSPVDLTQESQAPEGQQDPQVQQELRGLQELQEPQGAGDNQNPQKEPTNFVEPTCELEIDMESEQAKRLPISPNLSVSEHDPDKKAKLEFQKVQDWFLSLEEPTLPDFVKYEIAKREECEWKEKIAREKLNNDFATDSSEELQTDEQLIEILDNPHPPCSTPEEKELEPEDSEPEDADLGDYEFDEFEPQEPEKDGSSPEGKEDTVIEMPTMKSKRKANFFEKDAARTRRVGLQRELHPKGAKGTPKKPKSKTVFTNAEIDELTTSDYVQTVQANRSMKPAPTSKSGNRKTVMAQIVSQVPDSEKEAARSDGRRIVEAARKYYGKPRHTEDGWKVQGLISLLLPYQLEAGGWMIGREKSHAKPHGGLLCHEMGLGKTITMLSIVFNERCSEDPGAPTLIVVPTTLVTHWLKEIDKHWNKKFQIRVISHSAGNKVRVPDLQQAFLDHDIVITTYYEITKSCPKPGSPPHDLSKQDADVWRNDTFDKRLGEFHKIKWHRIILDEAHVIKNKDVQVSVAVRALTGKRKWAITGTPLLNRTEELYPYLEFIEVPGISNYSEFTDDFFDGSERAKLKLKNIVRTVVHRRTHKNRLFGAPLVDLPNIAGTQIIVTLSAAEELLNQTMKVNFVENVNTLSSHPSKQATCILKLILQFRMFTSHILTAQDKVEDMLDDRLIDRMQVLANTEDESDERSQKIAQLLLGMAGRIAMCPAPPPIRDESECQRPRPVEDQRLGAKYTAHIRDLQERGHWNECLELSNCARCSCILQESFLTSCLHRYCEECFEVLPNEKGEADTAERKCYECGLNIKSILFCKNVPESQDQTSQSSSGEKRKNTGTRRSGSQKKSKTSAQHERKSKHNFHEWLHNSESSFRWEKRSSIPVNIGAEPQPMAKPEHDWISQVGNMMPGAKITAAQNQVAKWLAEDKKAKIVIFTEFLRTSRLLRYMCRENEWGYTLMNGKMSVKSREAEMKEFENNDDKVILIASMKTGGAGLNLTMANRCIIYDLWWNEAIEQQAYCRLHRIGQLRDVEFVRLIAKDSIDEYMFKLQQQKLVEINQYIGQKNLMSRNSLKELLSMFGDVSETPELGFFIKPRKDPAPEEPAGEPVSAELSGMN